MYFGEIFVQKKIIFSKIEKFIHIIMGVTRIHTKL